MVLLLFLRSERVPPLAEYFRHGAIVLIGVALVNEGTVTLAEDHERVHRPPDVVFFFSLKFKTDNTFLSVLTDNLFP